MTKNELVKKNLELHAEWMKYLFQHPEVLDEIPAGAQVVILPDNEPELAKENSKIIQKLKTEKLPIVIVHLELPKFPAPKIEMVPAHI